MLSEPLRTPLFNLHFGLEAQIGIVHGWSMPMTYGNSANEYLAATTTVGVGDSSNQVKIEISGEGAPLFLEKVTTSNLLDLLPGQARKTLLCRKDGSILDMALVLRFPDRFLLLGASGDAPTTYRWLQKHAVPGVTLTNLTHGLAVLSLRGPQAIDVLDDLTHASHAALVPLQIAVEVVDTIPVTVLRHGDHASSWFDILCAANDAIMLWHRLAPRALEAPPYAFGQITAELLRVEAGLPAFGSEIGADSNPFELGLGQRVDFAKREFVGRQGLKRCIKLGLNQQLVGIQGSALEDELRRGQLLFSDGRQVGEVTSAADSPRRRSSIALARVDLDFAAPETSLDVRLPGHRFPVTVVALPFHS